MRVTAPSTWPWIDHPVSGLHPATKTLYSNSLSLRLRIPCLTSLVIVTRRSVLQKVRHHIAALTVCKHMVSGSISLPSRGAFHLSFTVLFAIGHQVVFRLGGWSPLLPTGFHVPRGTLDTARQLKLSSTGFSPSSIGLPMPFD